MIPPTSIPSALPEAAVAALERGQTIEAIKIVRRQRSIGLKEAKDVVDGYLGSRPDLRRRLEAAQADALRGLARWVAIFLAVAGAMAYFAMRGQ